MKGMKYLELVKKGACMCRSHPVPIREMPLYDKWQDCETIARVNGNMKAVERMKLAQEVYRTFSTSWRLNGRNEMEFVPYDGKAKALLRRARDSGVDSSLTVLTLRVIREYIEHDHVKSDRKIELIALCKDAERREEAVNAVFDLLMENERFGYAIVVAVLCQMDEPKLEDAMVKEARKRYEDNRKGKGERQLAKRLWGD